MSFDKEAISILQPNEHLEKKKSIKSINQCKKEKLPQQKKICWKKNEINISP